MREGGEREKKETGGRGVKIRSKIVRGRRVQVWIEGAEKYGGNGMKEIG